MGHRAALQGGYPPSRRGSGKNVKLQGGKPPYSKGISLEWGIERLCKADIRLAGEGTVQK